MWKTVHVASANARPAVAFPTASFIFPLVEGGVGAIASFSKKARQTLALLSYDATVWEAFVTSIS